jgi:hypothetical protein
VPGWTAASGREKIIAGRNRKYMPVSGESIRLMNYVDDISTTLRRIHALMPALTTEEKQRLADYMRKSDPGFDDIVKSLEVK